MDVDGVPIRSVLVVDDRPEDVVDLVNLLKGQGVTVFQATGSDQARDLLSNRPELDLVVLDWYLSGDNSVEAQLVLRGMTDCLFAPVVVWTKHPQDLETTEIPFPRQMLLPASKTSINTATALVDHLRNWLSNKRPIKIGLLWGFGVQQDLNRALWNIQELSGDDLSQVIDSYRRESLDQKSAVHAEEVSRNLVFLFLKALSRKQVSDTKLIAQIAREIQAMEPPKGAPQTTEGYERLRAFDQYIPPPWKQPVWTGDIIQIRDGGFGIVITPACDIAIAKTHHIQLLRLRPWAEARGMPEIEKKHENVVRNADPRYQFLPYVPGHDALVCFFEEVSTIPVDKYQKGIQAGEITCLATLDSPYFENLAQRYIAYLGRLGVPDLAEGAQKPFLKPDKPEDPASSL